MTGEIVNNKIIITNPISKNEIGQLDLCTESNFKIIVEKATQYNDWSSLTINQRCKYINKFRKYFRR